MHMDHPQNAQPDALAAWEAIVPAITDLHGPTDCGGVPAIVQIVQLQHCARLLRTVGVFLPSGSSVAGSLGSATPSCSTSVIAPLMMCHVCSHCRTVRPQAVACLQQAPGFRPGQCMYNTLLAFCQVTDRPLKRQATCTTWKGRESRHFQDFCMTTCCQSL